jgi:hypothetical protein
MKSSPSGRRAVAAMSALALALASMAAATSAQAEARTGRGQGETRASACANAKDDAGRTSGNEKVDGYSACECSDRGEDYSSASTRWVCTVDAYISKRDKD